MASYNPPSEQLPIFDNAVFQPQTGSGGLTEAQANLLYLRKTFPDTATAIETFQAGIKTDNIDSFTGPLTISGVDINIGTIGIANTINNNCSDYYLTSSSAITNVANGYDVNANVISFNSNNGSLNSNYIGNETTSTYTQLSGLNCALVGTTIFTVAPTVNMGDISVTNNLNLTSLTNITTECPTLKLNSTYASPNTVAIGNSTGTTTITINRPLTIGYSPVFTTATQIGYTISTTTANSGIATQTVWQPQFLIFNGLTLGSGVWLINYSCRLSTSGVSTLSQYSMWVNGTTGNDAQYGQSMTSASIQCGSGVGNLFGNGSTVQTYTGASNLVHIAFFGTGTLSGTLSLKAGNNILSATRLA